jgi:EAL domain-containing protein (putative c-di-GMP-specific phosphodiesterase class I)
MYQAKDDGRNTYQFYNEVMTEKAFERIAMEASFRNALNKEEFVVHFQPQIDAETDQIIGMEALVRWQHPDMGLISPSRFLTFANDTGLIISLDQWVMKTAMKQYAHWYKQGLQPGILALNLSMRQLQKEDFIDTIQSLLKETACQAQWIELEITEGQIMEDFSVAIEILNKIKDLGISLAIDDFGIGYSSLSQLKRLPINKLKIDRSFIRELPHDEEDVVISKTIIALSKNMGLSVIAEGVETEQQKDFLLQNGCHYIQGYYYCKPLVADEIEVRLRTQAET